MPVGLVPAPPAGCNEYFLGSKGWKTATNTDFYLCADGSWRIGDYKNLFLQGNGLWNSMKPEHIVGDIPLYSYFKFGTYGGDPIEWISVARDHTGFPQDSVTLVSRWILAILPFDAREPNNANAYRRQYGNNDYTVSNIRQWLNSSAPAGQWYAPQHDKDHEPNSGYVSYNPYDIKPGFLYEFTEKETESLLPTTRYVGNFKDNGNTCVDKVWLPTGTEYNIQTLANDGSVLEVYASEPAGPVGLTAKAVSDSTYKGNGVAAGSAWKFYTASSYQTSSNFQVRAVVTSGSTYANCQDGTFGVRPAINLSLNLPISAEKDADGCYTILV